jgi:hypothetical protein
MPSRKSGGKKIGLDDKKMAKKIEQGLSFTGNNTGKIPNDLFEKIHLCTFALVCTKLHYDSANQIADIKPVSRVSRPIMNSKILFALKLKAHAQKHRNKYKYYLPCA